MFGLNFPGKKCGINSLNHETYREIHLEQDEELTQNWGAVKPTDLLGRCGMFHGIYQHYEMGFTKKKLRFNINQSSKIGHTHPTQMCFPSLVFSFRNPWFPHRVSARQSRGSGLPAQNNGRIPGPHRPVFALRQMCMYIYIYTHIYVFVYLFIYLCIDILLYIDMYYLYVYIFHRIHGEIQDFVHHS